jgi:anthranilate/para-aminobenzoate synthase component II
MGIAHTDLPIIGLQFHPESILTEYGYDLLKNFLKIADSSYS